MSGIFNQIMFNIRRGYYKYIGSGSSRDVFDLGNGYVVKIAKNMAGIAQNKSEYKISKSDKSKLFAKIIQISNDSSMLIMEKADKIYNISEVLNYFNVRNKRELLNLKELQNIKSNYNLLLGDLDRKSSWGIIKRRTVIIDYGLTKEVSQRYY
ncbi:MULTISPECIES: hypothetical protein [Clostridium]|jgi:hypothetical protein|uniref:Uncharacterized protein n=1 Tax=Clostridium saccharoperbutylacetonicum N1-4(HMT) TaxID=931276 RepID=M1MH73_9CLOT|nr:MULTISPECIES: hypothetical protein [Clostridium]AGF57249.1 hypothetical protein Cspa_c34880 [Clostridium saccharoperbutylacetonicum N1-4(HMT)]AQR95930.1 hypothetical protein CLSAP_32480 [Clostridium saccharoperbutylacetonicum]NRT61989.1 hypothetical protein [Clostridium saccharoperbutylacetonicum]NSB25318.1 hypothetical protein [Clostridium saccharoperbutylacetonicum]NSB31797.1 hypothetical protein [Clostridium saccharoperbutylacetonicum]